MNNDELNWRTHVIANTACFSVVYFRSPYPYDYDSCMNFLQRAYRRFDHLSKIIPLIGNVNTNRARRLRSMFYEIRHGFMAFPDDLQAQFCPTLFAHGQVAGATASPLSSAPEHSPVKAVGSEPAATCR